jgi:hypothetical protein
MEILLIVLGIAAVVGIYLWITYNALVALKIRVDEALERHHCSAQAPSRSNPKPY